MLLSGLFFVGCGESPADKLTLNPDREVVDVYAGESENITFTIGNYTNGIDTSLSFTLVDSTISSIESEHVKLEVVNKDGTKTTVKVTGKTGGKTTLVASTNEGNKKASVIINVKQYSSKFELKRNSLIYVSKTTPFIPSEKLFNFDDNATERKVTFHFTDAVSKANDNNAFVKAELVKDENDIYSVIFYQEDGFAVVRDEYKNVLEGTGISIVAKYYNPQTNATESQQFSLTVLYGFEDGTKIEAYDDAGAVEKIELVTNDDGDGTNNWRSKNFKVKVPHVENIEGTENVKFDVQNDKNGLISVQKVKNLDESTANIDVYDFEIVSTAVAASQTTIRLRLYYEIDGTSYVDSGDSSVEQQISIPVYVKIAPSKIVVNNVEQTSADNQYDFYNHYDGEFGWREFNIDVYATDSSFEHVLMTFDNDLIVKYKNKVYTAGVTTYQLKIDDVKQKVYVRGASDASATTSPKQIKFEVVSDYIRNECSYVCNYSILTGATRLEYDNPNTGYEYKPNQDNTGVFVSSSSIEAVFTHLITDNDFGYATVSYYDGQITAARVVYDGKEEYAGSALGKIVKLKIIPQKVGDVTYKITLDNGVSKLVTFRVIDTFDNFSVNLAGTGNDGVQSAEKVTAPEEGYNDEMKLVMQNTTEKDSDGNIKIVYDKKASLILGSSNGSSVFYSVTHSISNVGVVAVEGSDKTNYVVTTSKYGEGYIDFKAVGINVEDFKVSSITRFAKVNFTSFVPVYSLDVYDTNKDGVINAKANNISLYVGSMVSDSELQTARLSIKVEPQADAYGFYDPTSSDASTSVMRNENYNERYVYWTVNGANVYTLNNEPADLARMIYGQTYKIGPDAINYFGTFDTITGTFLINKDMKATFTFTMFASIRQYGNSKYFSVTIKGETYDFVERVYTNVSANELVFTPSKKSYEIGVYLNPATATNTEVVAKFISNNDNAPLINEKEIVIKEVGKGIQLVTIKLNEAVLNDAHTGTLSGVLQIIPKAWYVDDKIIAGYENSIIKMVINYADGTEENPYVLSSAEDVIAIGESDAAMKSHYRLSTTIDLSGYSSKLPLGGDKTFSGSIVGTDDASIVGINIKNVSATGNFGLFNSITGKIKNLTIKGSINLQTGSVVGGLLASNLAIGAQLTNVTAYISKSSIKAGANPVKFGGLVGENNGTIQDMCVIYEDFMTISSTSSEVRAGGIAGESTGSILGRKDVTSRFGISAYSVYALIKVEDENGQFVTTGSVGAVASQQTGGQILNILAGGELYAQRAGGIVADFAEGEATKIDGFTVRTQVRGQKVALIAVKAPQDSITFAEGSSDDPIKGFKIQATDDGVSTGIYASMYVLVKNAFEDGELNFKNDLIKDTFEEEEQNKPSLKHKLAIYDGPATIENYTSFDSYVNRTEISLANSIDFEYTNDQYFGDVLFVSRNAGLVEGKYNFAKQTTSFEVEPNEDNGFKRLVDNAGNGSNVIFAYYFEAAGYYGAQGYTTEQVYEAQLVLDDLNKLKLNTKFYPIKIAGSDISISSKSSLVEISASGELYIKGTGVAEIEVSSLLNRKNNEKIYLYIINYFNIESYLNEGPDKETGIFTLGDLVLGAESSFKVYSNAGVDVTISPSYYQTNFKVKDIVAKDAGSENTDNGVWASISRSGLVRISNQLIQLKSNHSVTAEAEGPLNHGAATPSRDGITFTKTNDVLDPNNASDTITLKASMKQTIDGKEYHLDITTLENVKINYYEGAKEIKSLNENYVLSSSIVVNDTFVIDSDDKGDEINKDAVKFVDKETGIGTKIFNVTFEQVTGKELTFNAQISVNKDSKEFQNRFTKNIYKEYKMILQAKSNKGYVKEIPILLVQENVDVIAFTNYALSAAENGGKLVLEETNNIVPGIRGMLSVTLSPLDADFDYVEIANNEMNTLDGASQGTFVIGMMVDGEFKVIPNAESIDGGVKISKSNLEKFFTENNNVNYQGQIFVRYIFSNRDVEDGTSVGIDVTVRQTGGDLSRTASYKFYKKDGVKLGLTGFTNKTFVARGLEYELDVSTIGYDESTVLLTSNKPQQAAIINRDGKYYVKITNDTIPYSNGIAGLPFTLTLSASKVDDFGGSVDDTCELNLTILEYVINYDNQTAQDIVSGTSNGVLTTAVGDKKQLAISFDGLVEYDHENNTVAAMVASFLNELSTKGTWTIYTDLNQNNASGEPTLALPISNLNSTKSVITEHEDFNIRYLKISDLALTTLQSHDPQVVRRYYFTYSGHYKVSGGKYVYENAQGALPINSQFDVYSYMRGSEESPNPVTTYKEFLEMEQGGYYIQLQDIHVPADEFAPLNTAIKYFDGNSYKFIFDDATYELGTTNSVGLFGTVNSGTIIKNITIQTGSEEVDYVTFNSSATSAINFGFVAGSNSGTITNAKIINGGVSSSLAFKNTPSTEGYYFGGVVGQNSGYITHSQSHIVIESVVSMGGVVGSNQGTVASSLFKNGKLTNKSIYNDIFGVGGVAAVNSESAVIVTSYSSGVVSGGRIYSMETDGSILDSSVPVGGFIFRNEGTIRDCYSNIPLVTTSRCAGFAFNNNGKIIRSFSTSKITNDNSATNFYFAGEGIGTFENCYYIKGTIINKTLSPLTHTGIAALTYNEEDNSNSPTITRNDFKDLANFFGEYSYAQVPSYNAVWFFSDGNISTAFPSQQFAGGRLELASANIVATSKKEHVRTTLNSDGIAVYIYATAKDTPDDGSVFNPYVIYSPETMENYFVTNNKIASGNYRLVCPIDYSSLASDYSRLYTIDMKGNFEANDMTISGITLSSNEKLDYAGLFGSITGAASGINASIMNLNLIPKEVVFNNASEVGGLVGRAQNANIYNINIYGASSGEEADVTDELTTVTGKNIVGGVVGLTKNSFNIKNVRSLIGAFATNVPSDKSQIDFEKEGSNYDNISFVGGIAGYVSGSGTIKNAYVNRAASNIIGGKAGFMYGGVAKEATIRNSYLYMNTAMRMKPYRYAGLIAGEIKGKLYDTYVYGYANVVDGTEELFALKPFAATAIGGIAGLLNGGEITTAYTSQGFAIGNQPTASVEINTVNYVGGIVGQVSGTGNKISQVVVAGNISAKNVLGGIVGQVSDGATLTMTSAACRANNLSMEGQNATPVVGGLIGKVGDNANATIANAYNLADITIKTYTYSTQIKANFGGIIGAANSDPENANKSIINLKNIYTTTYYNITLEDKSSTNTTGKVYSGWSGGANGEKNYSACHGQYYLDGYNKTNGEVGATEKVNNVDVNRDDFRRIDYALKSTSASVSNVFNSSIYGKVELYNSEPLECGYTTLMARKYGKISITANQNEYGTDLYTKAAATNEGEGLKKFKETAGDKLETFKLYWNLFNGVHGWIAAENQLSYLEFEESLELFG